MPVHKSKLIQASPEPRLGLSADPRAIRTRKALQDAFLCLLQGNAFEQITPLQIAAKAGVARGSFYLHYPTKDALLQEVARDAITSLYELGLEALDEGGSQAAALTNCRHIDANRALWSVLLNGGASGIIRAELIRLARTASAERAMPGDRLPAELSTAFAGSAMVEIIAWWLRQEQPYPAEFVADLMVELVFNPIRAVSTSASIRFAYVSSMTSSSKSSSKNSPRPG